ncbi:hypothetical protein PILCRDRAFT_823927, partial [Piloderma croceum F 1598]
MVFSGGWLAGFKVNLAQQKQQIRDVRTTRSARASPFSILRALSDQDGCQSGM